MSVKNQALLEIGFVDEETLKEMGGDLNDNTTETWRKRRKIKSIPFGKNHLYPLDELEKDLRERLEAKYSKPPRNTRKKAAEIL